MVEQTEVKFVADDGKEFTGINAEYECKVYERQKDQKKIELKFQRLNTKEIYIPVVAWYRCEDAALWKVELKSKEDYFTVYDYFKVVRNCYEVYIDEPKEYPCTLTLCEDCEYIGEYRGDLVTELQKVIEELGG
jgi:hypothetical protein